MPSFRVNSELILEAMQSKGVRDELEKAAKKYASRIDQLGASEGVQMNCYVESDVRPKGRPQSRILSDQVDQEWGSRDSERRRIMGRAAEEF